MAQNDSGAVAPPRFSQSLCTKTAMRKQEYLDLGLNVRWLDKQRAKHAYEYAHKFSSSKHYGLNEETTSEIERHVIRSYSIANAWLRKRISSEGTLQIVYGKSETCVIGAYEFLNYWENIFVPSRDDAIVLHNMNKSVLFYCHEQELEFGKRNA